MVEPDADELGQVAVAGPKAYAVQVVANARRLGDVLRGRGLALVGGGTDTHMVLVDLSGTGATGQEAEDALARAGITSNKNPIPFDAPRPSQWRGLRDWVETFERDHPLSATDLLQERRVLLRRGT